MRHAKKVLLLLLSWVVADSCIERVDFDIPAVTPMTSLSMVKLQMNRALM
jgi:hypothetical protein